MAFFSFWDLHQNNRRSDITLLKKTALSWLPFVLIYGFVAAFSSYPSLGILKLGWTFFNIGGAALVLLNTRFTPYIRLGFRWGLLAIAAFIVLQVFCLYFFQAASAEPYQDKALLVLNFFGYHIPLGIAQVGYSYYGVPLYRPCAFYYEPGYAGSAFIFALPLIFFMEKDNRCFPGFVPAG